ncbi:MAG: hypothetical protein ACK55Z_32045, partial [bacterium]
TRSKENNFYENKVVRATRGLGHFEPVRDTQELSLSGEVVRAKRGLGDFEPIRDTRELSLSGSTILNALHRR